MKQILLLLLCAFPAFAQEINYSEHIAPIIYKNCTGCHRQGEIGPMPFTKYEEVKAWAGMIKYVTENKYMPPFPPDRTFNTYVGMRGLSEEQINTIKTWAENGMPQGDPTKEPSLPVFPDGSQLGKPDIVLNMSQSFVHQGNNTDEYRVFVLPTGLLQDQEISAIEFRAGNKKIVHHVLIAMDTTGEARKLDEESPNEYGYISYGGGFGTNTRPFVGYVPGANPTTYPDNIGFLLPAKSDLLIQMHYGPTPVEEKDSSFVNIYFAKKKLERFMRDVVLLPFHLTNGPFVIPANKVTTFQAEYKVPIDATLWAIGPHAHLLNKFWKAVAVSPEGDTTNLIRINNYNFNWQGAYYFEKPVVVKRNSKILAWATYDNTTNNIKNPSNPPQQSGWGEKTTDEMFYLPIYYTIYKKGDENLIITNIENEVVPDLVSELTVTPNPVSNRIQFKYNPVSKNSILNIYDETGRKQKSIRLNTNTEEQLIDVSDLSRGSYVGIINAENTKSQIKFVVNK